MSSPNIGIQIGATTPPGELSAVAAEAELLGYEEIWLAEDYFELGGVASVAAALAVTEQIRLGSGLWRRLLVTRRRPRWNSPHSRASTRVGLWPASVTERRPGYNRWVFSPPPRSDC